MSWAILNNQILEPNYKSQHILLIVMEGDVKVEHDNECQTYHERNSQIENQRRQEFSMIWSQCMQVLLDKIKHDPDWDNRSKSYDPLTLLKLYEKKILAHTKDQYLYVTV